MRALSRFGFLEELDMRGTTSSKGLTSGQGESINDWQLTWKEMVTAVRDAHHPTLKQVLLQENVAALMRSNPALFAFDEIKIRDPQTSTIELVNARPELGSTGKSPPKLVRRRLSGMEARELDGDCRDTDFNVEYLFSRGWEVPVISGKCIITFVEKNPTCLVKSYYDPSCSMDTCNHSGSCGCNSSPRGWKSNSWCSSLRF